MNEPHQPKDQVLEVEESQWKDLARALEACVAERTADLAAAKRELESFAYTVAHDMRAPLRALDAFSNLLLQEHSAQLDDTGKDFVRRIMVAARQMDSLVQDLLAYSSIGTVQLELESIDLGLAVREAQHQLARSLRESNAEVNVRLPLPSVSAHSTILAQILANLIHNAAKFVAAGVQPRICIFAEDRGAKARLWVEDNGIGIPAEHHERIFRVFERLHGANAYPGTGIGLAIVKKGALRLQGNAGVESEPGKGSRFWVDLPKA